MAMGKRAVERQEDLFVMHDKLPKSPGHVFYIKLNRLLADAGFDAWVEAVCEPHYADNRGRPSVPPGVYFVAVHSLKLALPDLAGLGM